MEGVRRRPGRDGVDSAPAGVFPVVLRQRRIAARLTQEQLAERAGLSARSVSQLERGRVRYPRPESVRLLGNALGLADRELAEFQELARAEYWAEKDLHPGPDGAPSPADQAAQARRVPSQLPPDPAGFVGRRAEVADLDRLLDRLLEAGEPAQRHAARVCVLSGPVGTGKTALAVRWAHRVRERFPDGQLYGDLAGRPAGEPGAAAVLAGFLAALGAGRDLPGDAAARAALFRRATAGRRLLVVLDDAADAAQVRPLLPAGPGSAVLVTGRDPLPALDAARRLELAGLAEPDAVVLLRGLAGDRVDAEPTAAAALVAGCAGHPLALRLVAGAVAAGPPPRLADAVHELDAERDRRGPAAAAAGADGVLAVASWCYRRLPADAARGLRLLSGYPGPDLDAAAAAALLGTEEPAAARLLDQLAAAGFLHPAGPARFGLPEPLRGYAAELSGGADDEQDRSDALGRVCAYLVARATRSVRTLAADPAPGSPPGSPPGRPAPDQPAGPAADPGRAAGPEDGADRALAWLRAEERALPAAVRRAADDGRADSLIGLAGALGSYVHAEAAGSAPAGGAPAGGAPGGGAGELVRILLARLEEAAADRQELLLRQATAGRHDREAAREQGLQWRLVRGQLAAAARSVAAAAGARAGDARPRWEGNPYRGLWPFTEDHAEVFYGREAAAAALVGKLAERLDAPAAVVVTGASGAGKSSVLRAGLLPALARGLLGVPGSADWPRLTMTPTSRPLDELASQLAGLAGLPVAAVRRDLTERPEQVHLVVQQAVRAGRAGSSPGGPAPPGERPRDDPPARLVLVVDQFEEVFSERPDSDPAQAAAFVAALLAVAGTPCGPSGQPAALVVLGLRGDYWDRCAADPGLSGILQDGQFVVGPMTEAEFRRAVTGPAAAAGLEIEAGLTETILADVGSATPASGYPTGALPLLSQALFATYGNREGRRLTIRGYGSAGGVARAVATSAEATYQRLDAAGQALAAHLFQALTAVGADGLPVRHPVRVRDLTPGAGGAGGGAGGADAAGAARVEAVLAAFTDNRLLVRDHDTVEIAHDTLLHAWPRLRDWLADDHAGRVLYSDLTRQADRWQEHERDRSFLYRGTELTAARRLLARWRARPDRYPEPAPTTAAFLTASLRGQTVHRRTLAAAVAAVVLISATLGGFAAWQRHTAVAQRDLAQAQSATATARGLLIQAATVRGADVRTALRLAIAANLIRPSSEARGGLYTTLAGSPLIATLAGHTDAVTAVTFAPDGRTLVTASADGTARLWDVADRDHPARASTLTGRGAVYGLAVSPDGRTVATGSTDHTTALWDVTDRQHPVRTATLSSRTNAVYRLAFSPNGRTLAAPDTDDTTALWDVTDRRHPALAATLPTPLSLGTPAFSPGGSILAVPGPGDTVALWDVADRRHPVSAGGLRGGADAVTAVAFSPDGRTLATADADHTAALWDLTDRKHPIRTATLIGHSDVVTSVAFGPGGRTLATASLDGTARRWAVADRRHPVPTAVLAGHTDSVAGVAISPDGATLATASADHTAALWDVSDQGQWTRIAALSGGTGTVDAIAVSPDGRTLVTASNDIAAVVWDLADRRRPVRTALLTLEFGTVTAVAFGPDGRTLATGSVDGTAALWDLADPRRPARIATLTGHTDAVTAVAFGPGGRTLVTASADRTAALWDVADRRRPVRTATLTGHTDALTDVAVSPDGRTVVTAAVDRTAVLWDVADRQRPVRIATLAGHTDRVSAVAFAPDGRTVATGGADHTVVLWDVADRHRPVRDATLAAHVAAVTSVAFSPDGRTLATASADRTVQLWDVSDRRDPLRTAVLTGHTDAVAAVAFGPDGRTLATGAADQTAALWSIGPTLDLSAHLVDRACAAAGGGFTAAQWAVYIPSLPYAATC